MEGGGGRDHERGNHPTQSRSQRTCLSQCGMGTEGGIAERMERRWLKMRQESSNTKKQRKNKEDKYKRDAASAKTEECREERE